HPGSGDAQRALRSVPGVVRRAEGSDTLIYPLKGVAPGVSLGVVYLPAVVLVSVLWGLRLGLLTSLVSALAFNFFHIPPVGHFTVADGRDWVALVAFVTVAAVASTVAELARSRADRPEDLGARGGRGMPSHRRPRRWWRSTLGSSARGRRSPCSRGVTSRCGPPPASWPTRWPSRRAVRRSAPCPGSATVATWRPLSWPRPPSTSSLRGRSAASRD